MKLMDCLSELRSELGARISRADAEFGKTAEALDHLEKFFGDGTLVPQVAPADTADLLEKVLVDPKAAVRVLDRAQRKAMKGGVRRAGKGSVNKPEVSLTDAIREIVAPWGEFGTNRLRAEILKRYPGMEIKSLAARLCMMTDRGEFRSSGRGVSRHYTVVPRPEKVVAPRSTEPKEPRGAAMKRVINAGVKEAEGIAHRSNEKPKRTAAFKRIMNDFVEAAKSAPVVVPAKVEEKKDQPGRRGSTALPGPVSAPAAPQVVAKPAVRVSDGWGEGTVELAILECCRELSKGFTSAAVLGLMKTKHGKLLVREEPKNVARVMSAINFLIDDGRLSRTKKADFMAKIQAEYAWVE